MPELPEVETTRQGIVTHLEDSPIDNVIVRCKKLRWPVPAKLKQYLVGQRISVIERRAKYLLLRFDHGTLMIHLGMSGSLTILPKWIKPKKHDHIDWIFSNGQCLRFNDPRRFGSVLWHESSTPHRLLAQLGPEPLERGFQARYLLQQCQRRTQAIKQVIMDQRVVVGVGNIYANEALFRASIHPDRPAKQITLAETQDLCRAIKHILKQAIKAGGTTLKDFKSAENKPGYFQQTLQVYGRAGLPCRHCQTTLSLTRHNQRATVFCASCQK